MKVTPNAALTKLNSFGVDSHCAYFSEIESTEDIFNLLQKVNPGRIFVLGGGSNVLLPAYIESWVVSVGMKDIRVLRENDKSVKIRVGAGKNWHTFVLETLEKGWGGLENLSLIPGKVGAAPIQNIGAYGVEVEQFIDTVHGVDLYQKKKVAFTAAECEFAYRDSIFKGELKGKVLITAVDMKLPKAGTYVLNTTYGAIREQLSEWKLDQPTAKDVSKAVIAIRQSKLPDPNELGNAGSFFKNPVLSQVEFQELQEKFDRVVHYPVGQDQYKIPAAWLIDQCGWKGKRIGAVGCYDKQALVIVNYDGAATSSDIRNFAEKVHQSVKDRFGISLEREVNYIE